MRFYGVIAAISLLFAAACSQKAVTTGSGPQTLTIDSYALTHGTSDTLKFGRLHSGETVVKHLTLQNDTDEPFVIIRHDTSCHCTTFTYDRRPVLPGQTADIECTFDSSGTTGWQMKLVNLHISGAEHPLRIFIEADVE